MRQPSLRDSVHSLKDCSPREPPLRLLAPTKRQVHTFSLLVFSFFQQLSQSLCVPSVTQVHTRNETLEKLKFPADPSVQHPPLFDATNLDTLKRAISSFGSVKH